tara:strand:+ start:1749 stop:2099 length:351 start_codon:yes stop_codon:yes gene_type:complete
MSNDPTNKTEYPVYFNKYNNKYLLYDNVEYKVERQDGAVSRLNKENYDNLKTAFKNNNNIYDEKDPRLQKFKDYTKGPSLFGGRRKSKKTKRKSLKKRRKTKRKSLKKRRRTRRKH